MAHAAGGQGSSGSARPSGGSTGSAAGEESTFKILITTDNHLGFMERDPKRGDDSFTTFEEILRAARVEHAVDFMLLGGDLFHDNKPSLGCLNRTCTLFRKYLWGNKPIAFTLRSKAEDNFPTHGLPLANWQDPNMNIAVPVFAIHGNHDDPVGGTSSLDILANNGHLNYFGVVSSLEDIVIQPVLLQKGSTFIALYGLGNIRDDRLHRCFQLKKVHFIAPKTQAGVKWFNILILHQNRGMRDTRGKSGITEAMLAGFGMHLVIWGNEHEQRMVPEPTPHRFDIVQPGSSILTSITPLECNPKQYGILEVRGMSYRMTPFPLRSVRPVVRHTVQLYRDNPRGRTLDEVEDYLRTVVEEMVDEAERQLQDIPDDVLQFHPSIRFPLMRLSVDFSDPDSTAFPKPNFIRFGQQYMDVVANPGDMVKEIAASDKRSAVSRAALLRGRGGASTTAGGRKGAVPEGGGGGGGGGGSDAFHFAASIPQFRSVDIATKVAEVFSSGIRPPCQILSEMELSAAVYAFAEKNERDAIEDKIEEMLHTTQKMIWKRLGESEGILDPDVVAAEVRRCKMERERKFFRELEEMAASDVEEGEEGAGSDVKRGARGRGQADGKTGGGDDDGGATDNDADDVERAEAVRVMRLSQMFDGVPAGLGAATVGTAEPVQPKRGEVPSFLREHMRILLQQQPPGGLPPTPPPQLGGERAVRSNGCGSSGGAGGHGAQEVARTTGDDYEALLGAELEDLPADGLHHVTLDEFIAREVGEWQGTTAGAKRARGPTTAVTDAVSLIDVDADEAGGPGGVEVMGLNGDGQRGSRSRGAVVAASATVGQPTAVRRRGERQPGRGGARGSAAPSAVGGSATLTFFENGTGAPPRAALCAQGGRATGAVARAPPARPSSTTAAAATATLQLLSKWGSQRKGS